MNQRRRYSNQEKVNILREHFEQNVPATQICEKYRIHPHQFDRWKKLFFEKAAVALTSKGDSKAEQKKLDQLQRRLTDRNDVIAELLEENLKLKKSVGES